MESNKDEIIVKVDLKKMTFEAFQNFPEAAQCIYCKSYNYGQKSIDYNPDEFKENEFMFEFRDYEENKEYKVTFDKAKSAMRKFINEVWDGNYSVSRDQNILDLSNWDAWTFDAVAQIACFGEVIYG